MSYILHIDTSTEISVVAISNNGRLVATCINNEARNHAASINSMAAEVTVTAGITLSMLHAIAVCSGPGSYTGVRIAMSSAKGYCYALGIPLMAHDRLFLTSLKENEKKCPAYASVLTARNGEYFVGLYNEKMDTIVPPTHVFEVDLANIFDSINCIHITTDAHTDIFDKLKVNISSISSNITLNYHTWAEHAFAQYEIRQYNNIATVSPSYIKDVYIHK
jgi:tRNA threonylcarbamoyladenosine biosynthesis protein TsaB